MKAKFLRFGKCSLSLALSVLMIVSTTIVGSMENAGIKTVEQLSIANKTEDVSFYSDSENTLSVDFEDEVSEVSADEENTLGTISTESPTPTVFTSNNTEQSVEELVALGELQEEDAEAIKALNEKAKKSVPEASGASDPTVATGYKRAYFYNNQLWQEVYYYHSSSESWPGEAATKSVQYPNTYYADIPSTATFYIFNNNDKKQQTDNLTTFPDGTAWQSYGYKKQGKIGLDTILSTASSDEPFVIFFNCNESGWRDKNSEPSIHIYNVSGETAWHGRDLVKLKPDDSTNYLFYAILRTTDGDFQKDGTIVPFSSGTTYSYIMNGNSGKNQQTGNGTFTYTSGGSIFLDQMNTDVFNQYFSILYHIGNSSSTSDLNSSVDVKMGVEDGKVVAYADLPVSGHENTNIYFALASTTNSDGSNKEIRSAYNADNVLSITGDSISGSGQEMNGKYVARFTYSDSDIETVRVYIENFKDNKAYYAIKSGSTDGVTVYAKSGTIRYDNTYGDFAKYSYLADVTLLTSTENENTSTTDKSYTVSGTTYNRVRKLVVDAGQTVTATVKIRDEYKSKYYVKAFDINGYSYNVIDQSQASSNGEYTVTYTTAATDKKVEITPIYYYFIDDTDAVTYNDSANFVTFYAEDFAGEVKDQWLGTIACYAYYNGDSDYTHKDSFTGTLTYDNKVQSALGGYPGQPMVYDGGSYTMQLPRYLYDTNGNRKASIEGITMNNYIWDDIHAQAKGISDRTTNNSQTYDYDDFAALLERGATDIIYSFKYRTYNNSNGSRSSYHPDGGNPRNSSTLSSTQFSNLTNGNGWDVLTDFYDYPVDVFANRLADYPEESNVTTVLDTNTDKVFVVSDGYVDYYLYGDANTTTDDEEYLGRYATRWNVYMYDTESSQYIRIGRMPPSAFLSDCIKAESKSKTQITTDDIDDDKFLSFAGVTFQSDTDSYTYNKTLLKREYVNLYNKCVGKPTVITYESALFSGNGIYAGSNNGTQDDSRNPGLRNDGRWYYSISGANITAKVKIQIVDEDGNIISSENAEDSKYDPMTGMHTGTATNANAYFTNKSVDVSGNSLYGTVSATVKQTKDEYFNFKADSYSYNSTTKKHYEFVGWYLNTGSSIYNPINYGTEATYSTGTRVMNSNATFVARYKEVTSEEDDASSRKLVIGHDLYSNSGSTDPTPHNGTGTPYVKVEIIDGNDVIKTYNGQGSVVINSGDDDNYLLDTYKVKITLTTVTDSETNVSNIYREVTGDTTSYVPYNEETGVTVSSLNTATDTNSNTFSVTYEYPVTALFPTVNGTPNYGFVRRDFFTDLYTLGNITVNFKYFDRDTANHSKPATISENPVTISLLASPSITDSETNTTTKSIQNAIINALYTEQSTITIDGTETTINNNVMSHLRNVIDNYYFWTSTDEAETGLKNMDFYGEKDENGDYVSYLKHYGTDNIDYTLHTNAFGNPKGVSENKYNYSTDNSDKWVTYKTVGSTTPVVYNSTTSMDDGQLSTVDSITVWVYNAPREYVVTSYVPVKDENGAYSTLNEIKPDSGFYYDISNSQAIRGFFNQRLGTKEENDTKGINSACDYLTSYGVTTVYLGELVAPIISDKVFDGWYLFNDGKLGAKVTSERSYGYRITGNINIIAVYKSAASTDNLPGVSVTSSGEDYYVKQSGDTGDLYVRLNTQMNVFYPGDFIDSDERIEQYSAIIIKLPVVDSNGEKLIWTSALLDELENYDSETKKGTNLRSIILNHLNDITDSTKINGSASFVIDITNVNVNKKGGINSFTYDVTWEDDDASSKEVKLTNKNRIMFTLPMKASQYEGGSNSALMSYAAIYYDTSEYDENGELIGDKTGQWILSENYVPFVHQ